jgi:nitroreductase
VSDCVRKYIDITDGKAEPKKTSCFDCGHCVAICPTGAIAQDGFIPSETVEYSPDTFDVPTANLQNLMKFRRSIRKYKPDKVAPEHIDLVLEAARYSPRAANRDMLRFIVIQDELEKYKLDIMQTMQNLANGVDGAEAAAAITPYYRKLWSSILDDYRQNHYDGLIYNAPALILVIGRKPGRGSILDGGLASSRMELIAASAGLGACHIGFITSAMEASPSLRQRFGLVEDEIVINTLILGYTNVRYQRTVNRRPLDITKL